MKENYEELKNSLQDLTCKCDEFRTTLFDINKIISNWGTLINIEKGKFYTVLRHHFTEFKLKVKVQGHYITASTEEYIVQHPLFPIIAIRGNTNLVSVSDLEFIDSDSAYLKLSFFDLDPDSKDNLLFLTRRGGVRFHVNSSDFFDFLISDRT